MKDYKFILLDLDYTLLDFSADMVMAFEKLYRHFGFDKEVPYSVEMLDTYEKHNNVWWGKYERGECSKPVLLRSRFVDFLAETGFTADPDELNETYLGFLGTGGVPYPGAIDFLKTLYERYQVYIVTNGNAYTAKHRLENSGVDKLIHGYFVSEAVGAFKPDKKYFDYVGEHIPGFKKDRAIIIGDSVSSDINGAVNAGIDSLWYTGARRECETAPCTYQAESYGEILDILLN